MPTAPARLPKFLRLNDARAEKRDLFATLSPPQIEILDTAGHRSGHVYGGVDSPTLLMSVGKEQRLVEDGMRDVEVLARCGWLRFARGPSGGGGYYWLTDSAERLWRVLGRLVE